MTTKGMNFSGQVPPSIIDTEYEGCNFSQPEPVNDGGTMKGVDIFQGDTTPRTFIDCLVTNCELPPGSTCEKKANIRENYKMIYKDTITIDEYSVEIENYAHVIYGYFHDGAYTYHPSPIVIKCDNPTE